MYVKINKKITNFLQRQPNKWSIELGICKTTQSSSDANLGIFYFPISYVLSHKSLILKHLHYTLTIYCQIEIVKLNHKLTFKTSIIENQYLRWKINLMLYKINNIWYTNDLSLEKKPIRCKHVYKIKYKVDGIEWPKAHCFVTGYT